MAIVRVLTSTGFFSDDFFGPATVTPESIGLNGTGELIGGFAAYGTGSITILRYQGSPDFADIDSYTGAVTGIVANDFANDLASIVFTTPVDVSWVGSRNGWFYSPQLFRASNPSVPADRFAGADDMEGNAGADVFFGYSGADDLRGLAGNDRLVGGAGSDRLEGGLGFDDMIGGAGNDTFIFKATESSSSDRVFGGEGDGAIGAGEINTLLITGAYDFSSTQISQIQRVAFTGMGSAAFDAPRVFASYISPSLILDGANGNQTVSFTRQSGGTTNLSGFSFVNWASGPDSIVLNGSPGLDTLLGTSQADVITGSGDNDQITGGFGGDYIDGGIGYDFARYDLATTGVQARLDNAALNTGEAAGDTMYNFEGLVGSQLGDILAGNNLAIGNQIYGLGGNDTIRGFGGADTIFGNAGADSIFTGDGTDTVWVQAADRIATQQDRIFDFADGQDHLRFQGILQASATITDSQGGTLIQFTVAGGQFSVFLDGITKAASADQIFFV